MDVRIRYFAGARDLAGCDEETLTFAEDRLPIIDVFARLCERHPSLSPYRMRLRLALNDEFASDGDAVGDGDEVAVLPPVAGGSGAEPDARCFLRDVPLSLDEAYAAVRHPGAGGIALFVGVVRDHADGKSVARLDYEAHATMAVREMERVLAGVESEQPEVRLHVQHRVGKLAVGDAAVIIAASAPHRAEAFDACRKAIDRIKETVPIWKKEWDAEGQPHWVNLEG